MSIFVSRIGLITISNKKKIDLKNIQISLEQIFVRIQNLSFFMLQIRTILIQKEDSVMWKESLCDLRGTPVKPNVDIYVLIHHLKLVSKIEGPFLISIAYQTIAYNYRRLNLLRLCPDCLKTIVYILGLLGDLGRAATNPIVYKQQSNRRLRSEIRPEVYNSLPLEL